MTLRRCGIALLVVLAGCGSESVVSPVVPPQQVRYTEAEIVEPDTAVAQPTCPPEETCSESTYAVGSG